ncbi:hypothetical protein [Bdellovibrio sp. HCB209]|uniref:hypothetical protein n=1 Tax=Bdellovibrio sp. HCB209 TaxID=3394354 RepID=UPI0039B5D0F8
MNNRGFALAIMIPLLPVLLGMAFAGYGVLSLIQIEQRFLFTCRSDGILGQEKAGKQIDALLKLNAKATQLKIQKTAAKLKVLATMGTPANFAAVKRLQSIQSQQQTLDTKQKQIISEGNRHLQEAQITTSRNIRKMAGDLKLYNSLFKAQYQTQGGATPRLAVIPDSTDIAPTYRTAPDIEERQSLVQKWQYRLSVQDHLHSFTAGSFKFEKSCSVSVTERNHSWVPKILRDKF